jgi:muconolactone delta-isomerase
MVTVHLSQTERCQRIEEIAAREAAGVRETARQLAAIWGYPVPAWANLGSPNVESHNRLPVMHMVSS